MSGKYGDIINLPHPTSQNHPRMSLHDRAAQFSPFAALTGHHAAIVETGRLTDRRIGARRERDRARRRRIAAPSRAASGEADGVHHLLRAG